MEITYQAILEHVRENCKTRGAWNNGVLQYVADLCSQLAENEQYNGMAADRFINAGRDAQKREMLNGAIDWRQYSEGGASLCYDVDIARRLCAPYELKKTSGGMKNPNSRETWLQVQARALYQAADRIMRAAQQLAQ